jgi:hypothetical protein
MAAVKEYKVRCRSPLISLKPSQPSHLSQPDVELACEGVCDGYTDDVKPSQEFEAICEGVTVVKVLPGISGV